MRTLYINHAPKEDEEYDVTFQCPVCLAIETLVIEKQSLMDSKHWRQQYVSTPDLAYFSYRQFPDQNIRE